MRRIVALALFGLVAPTVGAEPEHAASWAESAIAADGELQTARDALNQVFRFKIDNGQLSIPADAPLSAAFQTIQEQARKASQGFGSGSGSGGGGGQWMSHATFEGDTLSGRLIRSNNSAQLVLIEAQQPRRTLELRGISGWGFRIQVSTPNGEIVSLREGAGGRFSILVIASDRSYAGQAESFLAYVKENRQLVDRDILPLLAKFGVRPILPTDAAIVRDLVSATLIESIAGAEGKQLFDDLASDNRQVRQKAESLIGSRYPLLKDRVQASIEDPFTDAQTKASLERIVSAWTDLPLAEQTMAALDLANDPVYIVSLLDAMDARELAIVGGHLEKLTGQHFASDAAKWKAWAQGLDTRRE
jgi:hypothetical protein